MAQRSRIVLAAASGASNQEIAARLKISAVTVGKWRRLFAAHGIEGLRDAPRSGRPPQHDASVRHRVQTRVCQQPENQSRWSVRTHAMLVAASLQPHRIRTLTFSPDSDFEAKLLDIVALYLNPPDHAQPASGVSKVQATLEADEWHRFRISRTLQFPESLLGGLRDHASIRRSLTLDALVDSVMNCCAIVGPAFPEIFELDFWTAPLGSTPCAEHLSMPGFLISRYDRPMRLLVFLWDRAEWLVLYNDLF